MADFNPSPRDRITIGGLAYQVMPHPAVPTFAFGQEGRKAFVFQLAGGPDKSLYALKKFKEAFRLRELVGICDQLARFAQWPGLEVCDRQCLHNKKHGDALGQYPDLEYAVLMPWIGGSTWYDMVIGMTPLSRLEALTYANAVAQVLAAIEEAGLAHCDISAANVIVNPNTQRAHLIDVEDLYAPGFNPPASLPAGTDGYAHRTAVNGLWGPHADRFAGAVLIGEMASWWVPEIRKEAEEEHYFSPAEMQQDSPRYQLMRGVLDSLEPRLGDLLDAAWFSDTLDDCPRMKEWQEVISQVLHHEQVSGVVSGWQPLAIPGITQADTVPHQAEQAAPEPAPEGEATPAVRVEEQAAPLATQSTPQPAPAQPAPGTPIIQVPQITTPPPAVARTPIQVQPSPQVGGPVREWRPLNVPQQTSPASSAPVDRRPIWQPSSEPAAQPQAEEPGEPQPEDELPGPPPEETGYPAAEDAAPVGVEANAGPASELAHNKGNANPYEEVIDYYPAYDEAGSEPYAPVEAFDEDAYAHEFEVTAQAPRLDDAAAAGLFKPVLDLSHIDERNRPHLVWTESPGAVQYDLEEDSDPAFSAPKSYLIRAGDTRWSPRLLWRRSGRLFYRVRAENEDITGPWSDVLQVRIGRG